MKKIVTIALALVMVLGLAAPAMAFTTNEYVADTSIPYEIAIKLIDTDTRDIRYLNFYAPATDKGYVQNEVICAIASLYVPKKKDLFADGYTALTFSGDNINVEVVDNFAFDTKDVRYVDLYTSSNLSSAELDVLFGTLNKSGVFKDDAAASYKDNKIKIDLTNADKFFYDSGNQTYYFAFFAKVTGDDAYANVKLSKSASFSDMPAGLTPVKLGVAKLADAKYAVVGDYVIIKTEASVFDGISYGKYVYSVYDASLSDLKADRINDSGIFTEGEYDDGLAIPASFRVVVDKNYKSKAMIITAVYDMKTAPGLPANLLGVADYEMSYYSSTSTYKFDLNNNSTSVLDAAPGVALLDNRVTSAKATADVYGDLMDIYNDDVQDTFGLDYAYFGNVVNDSTWEGYGKARDLFEEVAVSPWYPYVEVPEEVVIDPPKTGDVSSFVGFAMIALAGLAIVAVKKVRA